MYVQGKDLKQGDRVRCISSISGIVEGDDATTNYLVTDTKDKKGNAIVVSLRNGSTASASPLSVWDTGNVVGPQRVG